MKEGIRAHVGEEEEKKIGIFNSALGVF